MRSNPINIQHPTSNVQRPTNAELGRWLLDIGCWTLKNTRIVFAGHSSSAPASSRRRFGRTIGGLAACALLCLALTAVAEEATNAAAASPRGPLELRLGEAVLMALTNNRALSVQRLNAEIRKTFEDAERAAFDPVLAVEAGFTRAFAATNGGAGGDADETVGGSAGVSQYLPTGTRLDLTVVADQESGDGRATAGRASISATQALLRGRPVAVNLVSLRQARLDTDISAYELRGFAETLVADVESAYWECVLAIRRAEIFEQSLALAEKQLEDVEQRTRVGSLPETEVAAARAEVALRREALIDARSGLSSARLRLLRLVAPDMLKGRRAEWLPVTEPAVPAVDLDAVSAHVAVALQKRPDMNEARLRARGGDLELVKTRNGLLPRMDLFVTLGDTGYADSFGGSIGGIDGKDLDVSAGVKFEFPVVNREARAVHRRAMFSREQMAESLKNLEDLVRVDVEAAYIEVERTREQVAATATTRKFQEEKLRAETAKFDVGRSTALLVAQAQRDLVSSQVADVEAVIRHLEAFVSLFRLEGSLLERRGVEAPGRQPVNLQKDRTSAAD